MRRRQRIGTIVGPLLAGFAALCCLGLAPLLGALSALGLGFLVSDAILIPLLAVSMLWTIWALAGDAKRHHDRRPLWLAVISLLLAIGGLWVSAMLVGAGLACLVVAAIWNARLVRAVRDDPEAPAC